MIQSRKEKDMAGQIRITPDQMRTCAGEFRTEETNQKEQGNLTGEQADVKTNVVQADLDLSKKMNLDGIGWGRDVMQM